MSTRLSYEPSVQALFDEVLPAGSTVAGSATALRNRVSWPLRVRTTGLGQIQGGEVVLAPPDRTETVLAQARELSHLGVAAVVLAAARPSPELVDQAADTVPVAQLPTSVDLKALQEQMERFIIRRRRELYELDQDLHRTLVEAAIGGMDLRDLLSVAARRVQRAVLLDQDGEVLVSPEDFSPPPEIVLAARVECQAHADDRVFLPGRSPALAMPVVTGRERRGIVLILDVDAAGMDEYEAVLSSLASACAIALARAPVVHTPSVQELLSRGVPGLSLVRADGADGTWCAAALRDSAVPGLRLERALSVELAARQLSFFVAREGDALVALINGGGVPWESIVRAVRVRTGSDTLRAGVSRLMRSGGARQAVEQALHALQRGGRDAVTRYEAIELDVLLAAIPSWQEFVAGTLGPLLESPASRRDLLRTLRVYLATGKNATEAARQLKVHRNTLLYRLRRIEELLQTDLERSADVFGLELALRILAAHGDQVSAGDDIG